MCKYMTFISFGKNFLSTHSESLLPESDKRLICICLHTDQTNDDRQKRYLQPNVSVEGWKWRSGTSVSRPVTWVVPIWPAPMMYCR